MKMKPFDSSAKKKLNAPNKKLAGKVGVDSKASKGATASNPRGQVGKFYEPDKSFTPDATKRTPKKPAAQKARVGRTAAAKKMASKKPTRNPFK